MKHSSRKVSPTSKTIFDVAHENMLYNVIMFALSAAYIGITQSIAAFNTLILSIQSKLQTIDTLRAVVHSPITGYASQKKAARSTLIAVSTDIMNAAYAFATDTNNIVLAEKMAKPATQFRDGDRQVIQVANAAIQAVTPFVTSGALTPYLITAASITTWQAAADQLASLMSNPQNAIANRIATNKTIYQLLNQCMYQITNGCDTLVSQLRTSNPDYYNQYWANRVLHEHHISTQGRFYVLDINGHPITQGEVYIVGTSRSAQLDSNGYALVDHIPFGNHEVSFATSQGSVTYGPYHFKKGKVITLHIQIGIFDDKKKTAPSKVTVTEETVAVDEK